MSTPNNVIAEIDATVRRAREAVESLLDDAHRLSQLGASLDVAVRDVGVTDFRKDPFSESEAGEAGRSGVNAYALLVQTRGWLEKIARANKASAERLGVGATVKPASRRRP